MQAGMCPVQTLSAMQFLNGSFSCDIFGQVNLSPGCQSHDRCPLEPGTCNRYVLESEQSCNRLNLPICAPARMASPQTNCGSISWSNKELGAGFFVSKSDIKT